MDMDELLKLPWVRQKADEWVKEHIVRELWLSWDKFLAAVRKPEKRKKMLADVFLSGFRGYDKPADPTYWSRKYIERHIGHNHAVHMTRWFKSAYMAGRAFATTYLT